ncbi:hypothetical protein ENKO_18350 [Enterobacter kobei]|uniref:Uncharacterized protein n=2 Tax=Enterobacter kobei TaxID=208224 RepID=A0AA86ISN7_9ENTR|nr:hypothetical protein BH713_12360 [Enterobacter kobei]BCU55241.1 hypothetical protein ENKO_18350 [Enterobacter kobei]
MAKAKTYAAEFIDRPWSDNVDRQQAKQLIAFAVENDVYIGGKVITTKKRNVAEHTAKDPYLMTLGQRFY